ncbi:hypothetical protein ACFOLC_05390 [Lysobacter cavernae]|uniref:Glycosyltransferase RgtA/B/C/D-like domain-containing protein n=1 Tax=Lysobacter cavernae TaxID=1685901 RepID=A0ABV7RLE1_9GAMM
MTLATKLWSTEMGAVPSRGKSQLITGVAAACARDMLRALLAIPLLLLLSLVLIQYGGQVLDAVAVGGIHTMYSVAGALVAGVALLFAFIVRRKEPFDARWFLPCSLLAAALLYYTYISSIQVAWVDDFSTMWQFALRMVSSADYTAASIYSERALPVLVPTVLLFGPNPAVVPCLNLVFLLVIQLAGYDLARRVAGHRAAQGFVVLWLAAMEPIFALPITSHDIWGLLFLVLFLWSTRIIADRLAQGRLSTPGDRTLLATSAIVMAGLLVLLDLQRELTPLVILGSGLAAIALLLRKEIIAVKYRPLLIFLAAVFVLYAGISVALKHGGYKLDEEQRDSRYLAQIRTGAYGSSLSNGSYYQGQAFRKAFFDQIDEKKRDDLAHAIPLSDFVLQPIARIGNIVHRARGQAMLGSQTYFYQAEAKPRWPWLVPLTRAYNVCYSIMLAALGLWLIVPLLRRMDSFDGLLQLSLLSTLVGVLLLVGESQPRYVFPVWFILPQLVSFAIASRPVLAGDCLPVRSIWGWDMTRGALMLLVGFITLALALRPVYSEARGRVLSGWTPMLSGVVGEPPGDWFGANQQLSASTIKRESSDGRSMGFGDLALVLRPPANIGTGGWVGARKKLCVGQDRRALEFFYYIAPVAGSMAERGTLELLVNDHILGRKQAASGGSIGHANFADILPAGTCGTVELRLHFDQGADITAVNNVPQADVYLARLAH